MMKKHNDAERLADEIMMAFGKELGEARINFCEALMDPDREDPPMFVEEEDWNFRAGDEKAAGDNWDDDWDDGWDLPPAAEKFENTEWKPIPVVTSRGGGRSKRRMRRALIVAAVLILIMGLALVAAEGVKLKKSTMHMRETTGESTKLTDIEKTKFDVDDFVVTYVPEGYELVEDVVVSDNIRKIRYDNDENDGIEIYIVKTAKYGANVDNEATKRVEVLVNDKQAYLFDDGKASFLIWQMGDCTVDIKGKIPEEELKQIAKYIFVN